MTRLSESQLNQVPQDVWVVKVNDAVTEETWSVYHTSIEEAVEFSKEVNQGESMQFATAPVLYKGA